ncbi:protein polyglycylase TTLL10 [Nematolebias whitei]|uniref:protein polyglycylase TTLL10 n=1 Tax=Nematolebias whitei TaxID=451745 RepID=UPI001899562D|nr:protein polyglycylase TTLL10 [Nematolebias whitei]
MESSLLDERLAFYPEALVFLFAQMKSQRSSFQPVDRRLTRQESHSWLADGCKRIPALVRACSLQSDRIPELLPVVDKEARSTGAAAGVERLAGTCLQALQVKQMLDSCDLQQIEDLSSHFWAEISSDSQAREIGQRRQREKKKEEAVVPCTNDRPAGSLRQEEPGAAQPSSPDRDDIQEMTSEESGLRILKCRLHKSKPRASLAFAHLDRDGGRQLKEPPVFFFGGANGVEIVSSYCESRGWKRIHDKHREDFRLKWCEIKSPAIYRHFREGQQLLYQIPNNDVLTTKIGLLCSLRAYERMSGTVRHSQRFRRLKIKDFIPTTFRMDTRQERNTFFALFTQQEGESESRMWICKPTGQNQGKGILLLESPEDVEAFRLKLKHMEDHKGACHLHNQPYIAQHYIQNPLLIDSRKFDVRSYLLIACTAPYMVFFRHGYVRLSCNIYDPKSKNLSTHLTNQYLQKKNPLYSQLKEDTVWSMENFNAYVNDRFQVARGLPRDWVLGAFAKRMQQIMTQCFFSVKSKLNCRLGLFDLIGCDFLVDEDFKVWLLEMNCNPALHTNCEVLKDVIPSTVVETLDLTLEIFNKRRLKQKIFPLVSQRDFVLLYNGVLAAGSASAADRCRLTNKRRPSITRRSYNTRNKSDSKGRSAAVARPATSQTTCVRRCDVSSGSQQANAEDNEQSEEAAQSSAD